MMTMEDMWRCIWGLELRGGGDWVQRAVMWRFGSGEARGLGKGMTNVEGTAGSVRLSGSLIELVWTGQKQGRGRRYGTILTHGQDVRVADGQGVASGFPPSSSGELVPEMGWWGGVWDRQSKAQRHTVLGGYACVRLVNGQAKSCVQ